MIGIDIAWRGDFTGAEVDLLHAGAFDHPLMSDGWRSQVERHSLGWVTARDDGELVGFVNVAWDGSGHAFIIDTMVSARVARRGIGTALVAAAVAGARDAGCEWLHVDFDPEHRTFYLDACGFTAAEAGLIRL